MAIDMLRSRWARAACAGRCRGSRVARRIARRRSGSAAIDCRSRRAQIAGGSGRATGRRPVNRSVRSAPLRAMPSCASAAVSGASLTVASMAGSSARPATSSTADTTRACEGCGQVAPLLRGVCAACQLRARVDELAAGAGPGIAGTLAPFLGDLTRAANPRSMLRWFCCPGFGITRGLLADEIPISHAGLDEAAVGAANAVAFVRAKLVISGVLEPRDEASAAIRSLARHGGATARARCRSCACAGLREVAGRASARADRQEARRGHARLGEVRPVARERGDQARGVASWSAARARRSAPGPGRRVDCRRLEDAPSRPAVPCVVAARERDRRAPRRLGRSARRSSGDR
jgi:hypothetical protein